jgi:GNAT superfamily N-acetyltransferase
MALRQGQAKDVDYFERSFDYQDEGEREVLIAMLDGAPVGYCFLSWQPKYGFFKKLGLPEIQDLNVMPDFRRRGIARALIAHCENLARGRGLEHMGIGVGLDASYGPAQVLYVSLGYIPDGNGLTYDRKQVAAGEFRPVDGNLCLMMVKSLKNT